MPKFIYQANIAYFTQLIADEKDPEKLELLNRLLAEEKTKFAEYIANEPPPAGPSSAPTSFDPSNITYSPS